MNCGEKIAQLRKKNNMTQAQLGDELSVTYQAVSKWERGESLPDFDTISRISKLFQVPISYFEDGGEETVNTAPHVTQTPLPVQPAVSADIIGMCVQCGKVVRDGEAAQTNPKLICKACDELNRKAHEEQVLKQKKQALVNEKAAKLRKDMEKSGLRERRNLALLLSIIPAGVVLIIFTALSIVNKDMFTFLFVTGIVLAVFAYTFTAQMIWDGTVREVCTGGGHIISLPGIIFSLSPDGILFLILTKIILVFVAAFVFVFSIIACVFAAIFISPFTFVPSLLLYNRKIRKVDNK
ncbi:MAG: helix-turn-helix transcriptional regulator [Clostridiales bacterium]|nr:helix-turn-helix transcriptional regulator [Clostridiales bacterium]